MSSRRVSPCQPIAALLCQVHRRAFLSLNIRGQQKMSSRRFLAGFGVARTALNLNFWSHLIHPTLPNETLCGDVCRRGFVF